MNDLRERLIEIIQKSNQETYGRLYPVGSATIADKLIEMGIILPKFKKGQTVWLVYTKNQKMPFEFIIKNFEFYSEENKFIYIDKTGQFAQERCLYETEAEAQKALKELK